VPRIIENVLLDIDGTLIDSNEAHARAWVDLLERYDAAIPLSRMRLMIGMGGDKILERIYGEKPDEKKIEKMGAERDEIFVSQYLPDVKVLPGAPDFVRTMYTKGLRVVLATSARETLLGDFRAMLQIDDWCHGFVTSTDVEASKPEPDILIAGIKKYGFDRNRTVMIGDSPYDIEAARAVPCRSIAVRTGGFPAQMLELADEQYESVLELSRLMPQSILMR
jgi:HAD superfamily hydrolase (TIGR01509 family)